MTEHTHLTPSQILDQKAQAGENHGASQTRAFGHRPDGGSAETVEPISDAYYPSAVVELDEDNDHVLRRSRDDAMTNEGFKSLPDGDEELIAGVG